MQRSQGRRSEGVIEMAYATRPMHDADSHIMEPPDWLHPYMDAGTREQFPSVWVVRDNELDVSDVVEKATAKHHDPEYRADDEAQITLRKNFLATGSFLNEDRPAALDHLGFASQLVFDTYTSPHVLRFDREHNYELAVALARA